MNRVRTIACLVAVAACFACGATFAADKDVTLTGKYVWERQDGGVPGEIKAVFTPTGKHAWDVVFHFEWEGEMRAWAGHAKGSLKNGELEGEGVEERDRKRTFVFSGTVEDGVFTGTHGRMRDGEMSNSGTLTLE